MAASPASIERAIEGVRAAAAGHPAHEEISAHLDRVFKAASAGRKDPQDDSPGKREAGALAHQREIPAERAHDGGGGNTVSNHPGAASLPDRAPILSEDHPQDEQGHNSSAGPQRSGGMVISVLPPGTPRGGQVPFRTVAAQKGAIKEPAKSSGGNARSNPPASAAAHGERVGAAPEPTKARGEGNTGRFEKEPGYVGKEALGGDKWQRAAQGVRERFAAAKGGRNR